MCITRMEATANSTSPTQLEKTDAQQMPKFTMARQNEKVSTQVHVKFHSFSYYEGGKNNSTQKV